MNTTLGFLGTGKITSAVVRGLCSADDRPDRVLVSPRNAERAAALEEGIDNVSIARDNQHLVDESDILFLAVRPADAEAIIRPLRCRADTRVISLLPTILAGTVAEWVAPARSIFRACPLPSCAFGRGPILVWGDDRTSRDLLSRIGELVEVATEDELHRLWVISGVISPLYDVFASLSDWTHAGGVQRDVAERYVAAMTQCLCELRMSGENGSFLELADEAKTKGGLNEQAARMIAEARAPQAFSVALEELLRRFESAIDSAASRPTKSLD